MTTANHLQNPLDQFQSHSVHYVVLASRSTDDIHEFTKDTPAAQSESLSAVDNTLALGDEVKLTPTSSVYLMLDTRRFSQFMVENFELETYITGFSVPGSLSPNSTAVDMKFTVLDSTGISFANFLQHLMDQKLQVSFDGMTLLIRVLFIGHRVDGTSAVVQSITIPAMFKQIQVDLNEVKGVYTCSLIPLIGMGSNARNNQKWTNIGTASTYFTGPSANTLGAVVSSFERRLNEESIKRYTSLNAETQTDGTRKTVGHFGRPVQYMITLPKNWAAFPFSGPTQGGAVETIFKNIEKAKSAESAAAAQKRAQQNPQAPAKDSFVAVDPSLTITEVLDVIFSQTLDVAKLGNFTRKQDTDGNIRFYKHLITVTSDDQSFTVHVDVVEYVVPNADLQTKNTAISHEGNDLFTDTILENGTKGRVPKQFVEYDYIFSGTNIDVLSLDLKIENLNILLMQGVKLGQGEVFTTGDDAQKQTDGDGVSTDKRPVFGLRQKDPTLIPMRTKGEKTNFSNLGANAQSSDSDMSPQAMNQQYIRNLSAFYNAGPVDVVMTLRGNPDLMAHVALQTMPKHVSALTITPGGELSGTNESVKTEYRTRFESDLLRLNNIDGKPGDPVNSRLMTGRNFVSSPFFMKVNVFGPNVDYITGAAAPGDYTQRLFYDNYYLVDKVVSKIENARFVQEVSLRSFSIFSFPTTVTKGANTSTVKDVK